MSSASIERTNNTPYPGLRAYRSDEAEFFFGREENIARLVRTLESQRFLVVVGPSGCGKSSLVRAGLIPALEGVFASSANLRWLVAEMRPGEAPFGRLAAALRQSVAPRGERGDEPEVTGLLEGTLRQGPFGLVNALREWCFPAEANLLLLVDQFEEIFRYRRHTSDNDAEAFVNLLIESVEQARRSHERNGIPAIYIVLTVRSDFLGDYPLFPRLTEAMDETLFLTPRLTRDQCFGAIVGPARFSGGNVELSLANQLLNDMRDDLDQLPLLQHALMRMWDQRMDFQRSTEDTNSKVVLTLDDYQSIGGLDLALDYHADRTLQQLDGDQQTIAEVMFRRISECNADGRLTRRPTTLRDVAAVANVAIPLAKEVANAFRRADRSFISPPSDVPLESDTIIDIGHESLIRQWRTLTSWISVEVDSAHTYLRLQDAARRWSRGEAALLMDPELAITLSWRQRETPNENWAQRYGDDFELAIEYLDASNAAHERNLTNAQKLEKKFDDIANSKRASPVFPFGWLFHRSDHEFDVFLCHNSTDKPEVKQIGKNLKEWDLRPWLDEWELPPGVIWQVALEEQISTIRSAAVFVGPDGQGPWQNMEVRVFLNEFLKRRCPIIPVILPGVKGEPVLPLFCTAMTWVDFRKATPNPIEHLVWGITGERPKSD